MKPEKSFGEIWSELTDEQSEYLKGYINRQRIDATNIHERVSTKQIEKLEAEKAELLEALEEFVEAVKDEYIILQNNTDEECANYLLNKAETAIKKATE